MTYQLGMDEDDGKERDNYMRCLKTIDQVDVHPGDGRRQWDGMIR